MIKGKEELEDRERSIIERAGTIAKRRKQSHKLYRIEMPRNESIKLRRKNQEINLNEAAENGEVHSTVDI